MSKSLQQMTQAASAQANDLLYLVRGNNDFKILVKDILPNVGNNGYESLTYAQLAALVTNSELVTGRTYFINDRDIFVKATTKNLLDPWGVWLQRLPDYNNITGNFIGIWEQSLTPQVGDLVAWDGKMYENTTGVNNVNPPNFDAINWQELPFTDTRYNIEYAALLYDFIQDAKIRVIDKRGNDICQNSIELFKFGDDNTRFNTVENHGVVKNLNCYSIFRNNYISSCIFDVNLNKSDVESNSIIGVSNLSLSYIGFTGGIFMSNKIFLYLPLNITGIHYANVLDRNYSTFMVYLNITGQTTIDLSNIQYAGIVFLQSANSIENITSIINMPSHKVRFQTLSGLQVTFVNGVINNPNNVVNNRMVGLPPYDRIVNTAADGSFIEYRFENNNPIEVAYAKYN